MKTAPHRRKSRLAAAALVCTCVALAAAARAQDAPTSQAEATTDAAPAGATTAAPAAAVQAAVAADSAPPVAAPPSPLPPPDANQAQSAALAAAEARAAALEARVATLEQAQLESTVAEVDASELASPDLFRIYGFADFGVNHAWADERSFVHGVVLRDTTFTLGNLNLYFDFKPGPEWQVLAELRFTTYPHGVVQSYATPLGGEYVRSSTDVVDVVSPGTYTTLRWGGVVLERAYAQWSSSELFNVRVGQFLTPYGIWNVDHGSPTLIAPMLPHFFAAEAFPTRQIGVELHGTLLRDAFEYSYHLYVSNGRTATQVDFTEDKALGVRMQLARHLPVPMALGASLYHGQIDDVAKTIDSFDPFHVTTEQSVEGREIGISVDLSLDIDALRIRSEGVARIVRFEPGKRPPLAFGFGPPDAKEPDRNEFYAYLLLAYRLPWLGLEPFAYGELNHFISPFGDDQAIASVGLNVYFTPYAQLKTQVARALFFDLDQGGDFSLNNLTLLYSRLALAF